MKCTEVLWELQSFSGVPEESNCHVEYLGRVPEVGAF